jgi:transcriptional regulator with XRE-family HTH domain
MVNTRLRATLNANGYTEADLASELGVDAKTVQRWVTQDRTPHRSTAAKVAKLLARLRLRPPSCVVRQRG